MHLQRPNYPFHWLTNNNNNNTPSVLCHAPMTNNCVKTSVTLFSQPPHIYLNNNITKSKKKTEDSEK